METPNQVARTQQVKEVAQTVATATAEASWPQTRAVLRVIFIILAVAAILWILYALEGVILLVVLAVFFAYLISPLVELVRRPFKFRGHEHTMPRGVAIGIVYFALFGGLGVSVYVLIPFLGSQIAEFTEQFPTYLQTARGQQQALNRVFQRLDLPPSAREAVTNAALRGLDVAEQYIQSALGSLVGWLAYIPWLILIPILGFFLLKDAEGFRDSALKMLPRGRLRWRGDEFFQDVNSTLAAYIRAQLTACLLIGVICSIGFWLLGVRYWLALGIFAGMLEFIPLAGPLVVAVVTASVAAFSSPGKALMVLLFLGVLRIIHDYAIYPRIIGQGIHLHPLAVVLAILCGEELAGLAGIFLAIPVIAILTVTYRHWLEHRGSTGLVAEILKPAEQGTTLPAPFETTATPPPTSPASPANVPSG
jgi:predicted PurR-regulated permease PerM